MLDTGWETCAAAACVLIIFSPDYHASAQLELEAAKRELVAIALKLQDAEQQIFSLQSQALVAKAAEEKLTAEVRLFVLLLLKMPSSGRDRRQNGASGRHLSGIGLIAGDENQGAGTGECRAEASACCSSRPSTAAVFTRVEAVLFGVWW
jgi:hypothetical protein